MGVVPDDAYFSALLSGKGIIQGTVAERGAAYNQEAFYASGALEAGGRKSVQYGIEQTEFRIGNDLHSDLVVREHAAGEGFREANVQ